MTDLEAAQGGFNDQIGFVVDHCDGTAVKARLDIDDRHLQPFGLVHGGVYAAIAEALASMGTYIGTGGDRFVAGSSNLTHFLRPVFKGDAITCTGAPIHTGRTQWIWDIEVLNGEGKRCATTRVTIAVRDAPKG